MKISIRDLKNNSLYSTAGAFACRPFVFCAALSISILLICILTNIYLRIFSIIVSAIMGFFFYKSKKVYSKFGPHTKAVYIIASFMSFLLCAGAIYQCDVKSAICKKYVSETAEITAYAVPNELNTVVITEIDGEKVSYRARLYGAYLPDEYELFTCTGKINTVKNSTLSNSSYNIGNNISFTVKSDALTPTGTYSSSVFSHFYKLNRQMRSFLYEHCDEHPGVISGLFLGNKNDIPDTVKADFSHTGLSHVIAVSGLHVIAALALLSFILSKTVARRGIRAAILIFAALFYALITGCVYSVMRAALMYTVLNLSVLLFRRNDSVTSLFLSLYVILLIKPYAILDISLQMSAISTFGIIVFAPPICARAEAVTGKLKGKMLKSILKYSSNSLIISVCAIIPLIPLSAYYFGKISIVSPLMTLIVSPFVLLILYTAPFTMILGFSEPLADLAGQLCDTCADIAVSAISFAAHHFNFEISLKYVFSDCILFAFSALIAAMLFLGIKKKRIYAFTGALFVAVYFVSAGVYHFTAADTDEMIYTCTSGDVICRVTDNKAVAVDVTNGVRSSYKVLFDSLYSRGILKLDTLVMTRCAEDHPRMLRELYADYGLKEIVIPKNDRYSDLLEVTAKELGISCSLYDADAGFYSERESLSVSAVHYLDAPRGCIIDFGGAVYTSGRTTDIDTQAEFPVFMYGTFSKVSETAVIPVKNTRLAVIPTEIKEKMFFRSEFDEYSKSTNILLFDDIAVIDMAKYSE